MNHWFAVAFGVTFGVIGALLAFVAVIWLVWFLWLFIGLQLKRHTHGRFGWGS